MQQPAALLDEAARVISNYFTEFPPARLAVVSGSGLGILRELGREVTCLPYGEIPGLGAGFVAGHEGCWSLLEVNGKWVHVLAGRRHLYEGVDACMVGFAMCILARLKIKRVILTNAAGGLVPWLNVGDLMLIRDHLNLMFRNPLVGSKVQRQGGKGILPVSPWAGSPCHVHDYWDDEINNHLESAAMDLGLDLKEGVYGAVSGPSYETRAEAAMLRALGAHAVGMSTVPEVIAARNAGLRVAGISLITNSHVRCTTPPSHEEVLAMARQSGEKLKNLITEFIWKT